MANEIWAALIGVVGALVGVWYGARLSREAARSLLAQQAKAEFASTFTETLFKLSGPVAENRIGDAWRPFRSVACWYLWASLDNKPVSK